MLKTGKADSDSEVAKEDTDACAVGLKDPKFLSWAVAKLGDAIPTLQFARFEPPPQGGVDQVLWENAVHDYLIDRFEVHFGLPEGALGGKGREA